MDEGIVCASRKLKYITWKSWIYSDQIIGYSHHFSKEDIRTSVGFVELKNQANKYV